MVIFHSFLYVYQKVIHHVTARTSRKPPLPPTWRSPNHRHPAGVRGPRGKTVAMGHFLSNQMGIEWVLNGQKVTARNDEIDEILEMMKYFWGLSWDFMSQMGILFFFNVGLGSKESPGKSWMRLGIQPSKYGANHQNMGINHQHDYMVHPWMGICLAN